MPGSRIVGWTAGTLAALSALVSCTGHKSTRVSTPITQAPAQSVHVQPLPATRTSSAAKATLNRSVPAGGPIKIALAEARAVCNFDWRQTVNARIAVAQRYATPVYAQEIAAASASGQWQLTQHDRESGTCAQPQAYIVGDAPNTATAQYVRVALAQTIRVGSGIARSQAFAAQYRLERQPDGSWLVAAEGDGG